MAENNYATKSRFLVQLCCPLYNKDVQRISIEPMSLSLYAVGKHRTQYPILLDACISSSVCLQSSGVDDEVCMENRRRWLQTEAVYRKSPTRIIRLPAASAAVVRDGHISTIIHYYRGLVIFKTGLHVGQLSLFVTSAEEGGYVFGSVCLSVCPSDYSQTCERILTKFYGGVGHGSRTK